MNLFDAAILGVVEGLTEFLPVSSTGHLILASTLLGLTQTDFLKSFEIVIQLGAILAVVVLYFKRFFEVQTLLKLIVGFLPTGIIGLALYHVVKTHLEGNVTIVLWALAVGGVVLVLFELLHTEGSQEGIESLTYKQCFLIGLFQSISIIPGISRSAATIVGGLILGIRRRTIVEFSFLLAVPTMIAASGLDLVKNASSFSSSDVGTLLVGFVVSFVVALASIRWLLSIVRNHNFVPFGIYRILIAIAFWAFVIA